MTIKNVLDFYFALYTVIELKVEMQDGISGKYRTCTKEQALQWLNGWYDNKVSAAGYKINPDFSKYPLVYIEYFGENA